jgi:hypothetical protein
MLSDSWVTVKKGRNITRRFSSGYVLPAKQDILRVDPRGLEPLTSAMRRRHEWFAIAHHCGWLLEVLCLPKANYGYSCSSLRVGGRGRLAAGLVYRWCSRCILKVKRLETAGERLSVNTASLLHPSQGSATLWNATRCFNGPKPVGTAKTWKWQLEQNVR